MTHVDLVVVGGGITGLAAAWEARQQGAEVVVLEADDQPGGKLRTSPVAGIPLDESADAFLARVPEAVTLCTELGIATELVSPATGRAYVWVDGTLRPLPEAQLLGVPTDLDAVASTGILSRAGLARARHDLQRPDTGEPATGRDNPTSTSAWPGEPSAEAGSIDAADRQAAPTDTSTRPGGGARGDANQGADHEGGSTDLRRGLLADESVGALVRRRLGDEVLDRLVAPLVGGIWAGDCDRLSLLTATPTLAEARSRGPSLVEGAASVRAAAIAAATGGPAPRASRPVFLAPRAGMVRLVEALRAALGDRIRTGHRVTAIDPVPLNGRGRWRVEVTRLPTSANTSTTITADGVVVATPAFSAAPLVAALSPRPAAALAAIDYASVALVTLAVPRRGIGRPLDGSGFLVPPSAGRLLTACSWTSSKWPHLTDDAGADDLVLLRASAGRDGDDRALAFDDAKLVDALLADLADTMDLRAAPIDVRVNRWSRSFPQPRPGHLDRVTTLEADLARDAPGLLVAGAWARGVGIPACIRAGRYAARAALAT